MDVIKMVDVNENGFIDFSGFFVILEIFIIFIRIYDRRDELVEIVVVDEDCEGI